MFIFFRPATYSAESQLFLKNSKQSRLFSIASTLGLGGETEVSFDKIKSVVESDFILDKLLFTEMTIKGKKDILYNHLIDLRKIEEKLKRTKEERQKSIDTDGSNPKDSLSLVLRKSLKAMINVTENKEQLIMVETKHKSEVYALEVNKHLVTLLLQFFKDVEIKDDLHSQQVLKNRLDSVKERLTYIENANARISDNSVNVVKLEGLLDRKRSEREMRILTEMYVEILKQLEIVNFKLLDKKSAIYILNSPNYPLKLNKRSLVVSIILGVFLGFALSASFVLMKHRYKQAILQLKIKESAQIEGSPGSVL